MRKRRGGRRRRGEPSCRWSYDFFGGLGAILKPFRAFEKVCTAAKKPSFTFACCPPTVYNHMQHTPNRIETEWHLSGANFPIQRMNGPQEERRVTPTRGAFAYV